MNISCHSLPFTGFLLKDQLLSVWGFPCMVLVASPLLLLIFFLCVYSLLVWLVCALVCFSWVFPVWDSLCLVNLIDYFFFHAGEILNYNLFKHFLTPFLFLFFFCDAYNSNVGAFDIFPEVSETILSCFHPFHFILLFRSYFHHFYLPVHWFVLLFQIFCY